MTKYLIIGGVAGGATAAARLRRLDEKAEITIFERGGHVSYANCGLPYYIGNVIRDRANLFLQTREGFKSRYNIDVRLNTDVTRINPAEKEIEAKDLGTGRMYKEKYDKLVLSPGATPLRPPIPGIDDERIFTLRNVAETDAIHQFILKEKPEQACIVGGGFIGLEMAENLSSLGIQVTVVELLDQVLGVIDYEMACIVQDHLRQKGVELILKDGLASFGRQGNRIRITLSSGKELSAGMVLLSIGVKPEADLARDAGLALGDFKGIRVNEYLQTSDPDIYALGDAVECLNPIIGKPMLIPLAGPANKQARIAADNIVSGNTVKYRGTIGTAAAKIFDLTVASTGLPARLLSKFGIPYMESITHSASHAGYYPGASQMAVKLLFSPKNGKVLGAQIVGYDGVDKRIDMIAATINLAGTVADLHEIEHAYAPPYSSAKDPVNIAGFVAENALTGLARTIEWKEIDSLDMSVTILLDVRTRREYSMGTIEGAINIPVDELRQRLLEIPVGKKIITFCQVGARSYLANRILRQSGHEEVYNLSGGYKTYKVAAGK